MPTAKGRPKGSFDHLLVADAETTGLHFQHDDPSVGHQAVSWGLIIADSQTLKPVEELYVEVKWNEASLERRMKDKTFGKRAEEIHGLTFQHLEKHGLDEEDAVMEMGELILKYFGTNTCVRMLGHNVHTFDMPFLRSMFRRHDLELKFGSRHYDTNSLGFFNYETYTSDQLFELMGYEARDAHNALDDARMSLGCARKTRQIMNQVMGV